MSLTGEQYADIVNRLHAVCTFPAAESLSDQTCCICQETYLECTGGEIPITLACGHTFGLTCTLKWTFSNIEGGNAEPSCPQCRMPFFRFEQQTEDSNDPIGFQIRGAARMSRYRRYRSPVRSGEVDAGIGLTADLMGWTDGQRRIDDTSPVTSHEHHDEDYFRSQDQTLTLADLEERLVSSILQDIMDAGRLVRDRRNSHSLSEDNEPAVSGSQAREIQDGHSEHDIRTPH
ncbi:MAG: hypothetical protein Q9182_005932 [Xanthomendoza sp. 2 TL-2023]